MVTFFKYLILISYLFKKEKVVYKLLFLVTVSSSTLFTLVRSYLMSFSFFTTWHNLKFLRLIIRFYFTSTFVLTPSKKTLAGLNAGMLCAGILIVVFFEMFLPVFSALVLIIKLPKPLK